MATSGKAHGKDLHFSIDNQSGTLKDISSYVRNVAGLPGEKEMGDVTAGGASGYAYYPGLQRATITLECVFDDSSDSAYDILKDFMSDTNTRSFEYGPAGDTAGYAKISGECRVSSLELPARVSDPLIFTVNLVLDGAVTIGTFS